MAISFNQIPIDLRTPGQYVEFDNSRAIQGLAPMPHRILLIGQGLATGSAAPGTPVRVIGADQAGALFGRGSMLAGMAAALKAGNETTECWALPLEDDGDAVAATGALEVSGTAAEAGTVALYIAGRRVRVGVAVGETGAAVAAKIAAAVTGNPDLPVTAAIDGQEPETVDLTCRWAGATGNDIDLRLGYFGEALPAGIAVAVGAMSGGTANPDVGQVFAAIGDAQYHSLILPYTDTANLMAVEEELATRWGPLKMIEGMAYAAARGSFAALAALGGGRNSPHVSILGAQGSPTPPWEWAAAYGGAIAFHGAIDPARPFQTLPLPGLLPPAETARFTREERDLLLRDGIATFLVDAGGRVLIERAITTYRLNAFDLPDISYLDVNTLLTLAYLRFTVRARISQKFPRHKLAGDGTLFGEGQAIVTPRIIRAELVALFALWEERGLVEGREQFKADLIVERDADDPNRVNALIPPDVVNQFRVFAGQVQFRL